MALQDGFVRANEYYKKSEYEKAIIEYEKALNKGYASGLLYYNLGNAYYKTGRLGKAILNYDRAGTLIPRDADLAANQRFAGSSIKAGLIPEKKGVFAWGPLNSYINNFSVNEFCYIASGAYILIILFLTVVIIRKKLSARQLTIIIFLGIIVLFNAGIIYYKAGQISRGAIVIERDSEVLFGPFDSATKFFTLQEGMNVEVLNEKDDWRKVRRSDGKTGWVKKQAVERIEHGKNI